MENNIDLPEDQDAALNKVHFEKKLEDLINEYSEENVSDTPDFILAKYLRACLNAFNNGVNERRDWHSTENTKGWINK